MDGKVLYRMCIDTQRLVYRLSYWMTSTGNTGISHTGAQPYQYDKANLRDFIAVTDLVILLKLDSNRRFFSPYDIEIWWMTPTNNRSSLLYNIKLFASFQIHQKNSN